MILRLLFAVLLALPAFNALANASVDTATLAQALADDEPNSGRFIQRRYLADLDTTLESEGRYEYQRGERMTWRLERPVVETLSISSEGVERDGRPLEGLPAEVSRLILSLLDGDFAALESRFTITLEGTTQSWRATLIPRDEQLRQHLEHAELQGGARITKLGLWLGQGDRQTIELTPDAYE
ncbi:LolA family protein [Halotalea alkalilenta]|uniref:LolA family protein n=1 Tax=Halotalea alkalilenta TaxID=376489 RepID=UPI0004819961|nr:outer membrane lipoprotein carrier protein LolA [Halotalea alkalilenta]